MPGKNRIVRRIDAKPNKPFSVASGQGEGTGLTAPPAPPTLPKPTNLQLSAALAFSAVTPGARITATWRGLERYDRETYAVQIALDSGFTTEVETYATAPNQTSIAIGNRRVNTTYYVRVATVVGDSQSDWSAAASVTTPADTTAPGPPTGLSVAFINAGDLRIRWTNPTSANFRAVQIGIYSDVSKTVQYALVEDATGQYLWTAAQNLEATAQLGDPTVFVELKAVSYGNVFSTAVSASATKALPATPTGLTTSWAGDTGTAGADCVISWNSQTDAAFYRVTIDGVTRDVVSTRLVYTLDQNRAEHSGTPDPVLSIALAAYDGIKQGNAVSATATASNAAPTAATVTLNGGQNILTALLTSPLPPDTAAVEWAWETSTDNATWSSLRTQESPDTEQHYETTLDGQNYYRVTVRVKDQFGQYSPQTTSTAFLLDSVTIAGLRKLASYTDDAGTAPASLDVLKDGDLASGGVTYGIALRGTPTSAATTAADTSLVLSVPAGVQNGDLLIAQIAYRGGTGNSVTTPAGWTLLRNDQNGSSVGMAIFYRIASNEPASYTFTTTASNTIAGGMAAYSGVSTSSPINTHGSQNTASSASIVAPSITPTVNGARVLGFFAVGNGSTWTPAGGQTEQWDVKSTAGSSNVSAELADESQAAAGATGTRTATASTSGAGIGTLVALTPAWRYDQMTRPLLDRYMRVTLAATGGEGYLGFSADGLTWAWYAGPLAADGRTLTAVASEAAAKAAPVALPTSNTWDIAVPVEARFVRVVHRPAAGAATYTLREFYPRRVVEADDIRAETIKALHIAANSITADRLFVLQLSAIAADLGTINAGTLNAVAINSATITGSTIQTAASGARVVLSSAAAGGIVGYGASDTYNVATGAGTYQVLWKKSDGKLYVGSSNFILDANGATLAALSAYSAGAALNWTAGGVSISNLYTVLSGGVGTAGLYAYVAGTATTAESNLNAQKVGFGSANVKTQFTNGNVGKVEIAVSELSPAASATVTVRSSGVTIDTGLNVGSATGAAAGQIATSGGVRINTTSLAGAMLTVNGAGTGSGTWGIIVRDSGSTNNFYIRDDGAGFLRAAAWTFGSDRRLKSKIRPMERRIDALMRLQPKRFDYISGEQDQIGFIAQDVQRVMPDLVRTVDEDGTLGLQTTNLIPVLVQALQEAYTRLDAIEARLA